MEKQEKETYKDYLVRKLTEELGEVFSNKMDDAKKELLDLDYKVVLTKTEEILKNYNKLKQHIKLTEINKKELLNETKEYYDEEIQNMMTGIFTEEDTSLGSLLKSRCKTKTFLHFIDNVITNYLNNKSEDKIEKRKQKILQEMYVKGIKQSDFIYDNYEVDRTFYTDKDRLLKDLAPYFFRYKRS